MKLIHICEACAKTEVLDSDEGFRQGWDYPPRMGAFGVLSPRTCGDCGIDKTLYWKVLLHDQQAQTDQEPLVLTDEEKVFLERVQAEPDSITPKEGDG